MAGKLGPWRTGTRFSYPRGPYSLSPFKRVNTSSVTRSISHDIDRLGNLQPAIEQLAKQGESQVVPIFMLHGLGKVPRRKLAPDRPRSLAVRRSSVGCIARVAKRVESRNY